eukprot:jgi/Chrzof1/7373/Cz02g21130.t1
MLEQNAGSRLMTVHSQGSYLKGFALHVALMVSEQLNAGDYVRLNLEGNKLPEEIEQLQRDMANKDLIPNPCHPRGLVTPRPSGIIFIYSLISLAGVPSVCGWSGVWNWKWPFGKTGNMTHTRACSNEQPLDNQGICPAVIARLEHDGNLLS